MPETGLDTSDILVGSRRRSLKPKVYTYEEMPRNYTRAPANQETKGGAGGNSDGGGGSGSSAKDDHGCILESGRSCPGYLDGSHGEEEGSISPKPRREKKKGTGLDKKEKSNISKKKKKKKDFKQHADEKGEKSNTSRGEGEGIQNGRRVPGPGANSDDPDGADDTFVEAFPPVIGVALRSKENGGSQFDHDSSAESDVPSLVPTTRGLASGEDNSNGLDPNVCSPDSREATVRGGTDRRSESSAPTSDETVAEAFPTTARKVFTRAGSAKGVPRGASRRPRQAADPVILTYVTHDRSTVREDGDSKGYTPDKGGAGAVDAGGGGGGFGGVTDGDGRDPASSPILARRGKRPRPKLEGASARAVVWGQPCPACCRREPPLADGTERGDSLERSDDGGRAGGDCGTAGGACQGASRVEKDGVEQAPVRPGDYVYLRTPLSEDIERSLASEGEYAVPLAGSLSGPELAGARIRVWRRDTDGSGNGGNGLRGNDGGFSSDKSGRNGDAGSYDEADVVQFDRFSGKHRLRFVVDGTIADVKLMEASAEGGDQTQNTGQGGAGEGKQSVEGVRWLQKRIRPRARDTIRRNLNGLSEGPSGELRGLVGDEHDPPAQRRENWRWAMSRWRWNIGERDGCSTTEAASATEGRYTVDNDGKGEAHRDTCEPVGVPPAGDGMFPPIGRVLDVEKRYVDTGEKVTTARHEVSGGGVETGEGSERRAAEFFLKVARLWYPQDTRNGLDTFIHGKAEMFEACRMVCEGDGDEGGNHRSLTSTRGSSTAPTGEERRHRRAPDLPKAEERRNDILTGEVAAKACCFERLDAEQPLNPSPKLEPIIMWVRACEARHRANVHPCRDGRLHPCAGKVVNDPYQPQAEFFLSHRYCLEADAYFPIVGVGSPRNNSGGVCRDGGDTASPRAGFDGGLSKHLSPRSTKARLLTRGMWDGTLDLPPKWHPLKKRVSAHMTRPAAVDRNSGSGGGRDSPVIGWESAIAWGGWTDAAMASSNRSASCVSPSSSVASSLGGPKHGPGGADENQVYLCHRCRHALPYRHMHKCLGRGCLNHFCLPCTAERAGGHGSEGLGPPRSTWTQHIGGGGIGEGATPREAFGGGTDGARGNTTVGRDDGQTSSAKSWTGPCCEGRCQCRECVTGEGEGLLSGWRARNGLSSIVAMPEPGHPAEARPGQSVAKASVTPKPKVSMMADPALTLTTHSCVAGGCSGWQGRRQHVKVDQGVTQPAMGWQCEAPRESDVGFDVGVGAAKAMTATKPSEDADAEGVAGVRDDSTHATATDTLIEWCRSCSGPSPSGSLARCYHCHGGAHVKGCQGHEEALSRRRLAEFGVGTSGQFAISPRGEGVVGHGVAVCVRGRWRAGLALCWSPTLAAHYLRFIDTWEAGKNTPEATSGLDAVPWEGEWVVLPETLDLPESKGGGVALGGELSRASGFAVRASAVRWPLVEVALRLFPPPPTTNDAGSGVVAGALPTLMSDRKPPSESRAATKVLKNLLKHNFLASQVASRSKSVDPPVRYRPPSVALPAAVATGDHSVDGDEQGKATDTRLPLWVCGVCIEAKLQRLQRRVRFQFQGPPKAVDEPPSSPPFPPPPTSVEQRSFKQKPAEETTLFSESRQEASLAWGGVAAPDCPNGDARPTPHATQSRSNSFSSKALHRVQTEHDAPPSVANSGDRQAGSEREPPEGGKGDVSDGGGWREASSRNSEDEGDGDGDGGAASVESEGDALPLLTHRRDQAGALEERSGRDTPPAITTTSVSGKVAAAEARAAMTEVTAVEKELAATVDEKRRLAATRRRSHGNRRLRWLPAGNIGSARPFAYEAGFVSDLDDLHANGGLTAAGAIVGTGKRRRGKKRPRPPPVTRAFAHLLGAVEKQSPLAFALPEDVTNLDRDLAAFLGNRRKGVTGGDGGDGGYVGESRFDDSAQSERSVVLVDEKSAALAGAGAAAAAAAATASAAARGSWSGLTTTPFKGAKGDSGASMVEGDAGGGDLRGGVSTAAFAALLHVPVEFSNVKELDLESSARIRPLTSCKPKRRRTSSFGGERDDTIGFRGGCAGRC